ncbi:MAG: hypothetical protein EP319_00635 [Deltaproteobacteria bacterium]|nr:MAG: hypothetical protein EP319_00635 [Deltaproteobacteria bacterium]
MKFLTGKGILFSIFVAACVGFVSVIVEKIEMHKIEKQVMMIEEVKSSVSSTIFNEGKYPSKIKIRETEFDVEYALDTRMVEFVEKLLKRHRSDYSAIVVMDNNNGNILAAVGYNKQEGDLDSSLPFSTTHPSASLFKIVTSANLLQMDGVSPDSVFSVRGRGTTLYKYQLRDNVDKWTRWMSLEKAFAFSNNVVFGKAAIEKLSGSSIYQTANLMGFNRELTQGLKLGKSTFVMPEDQYNLAEKASGFTKSTLISPVHAALLSSIVANEGVVIYPRLIKKISSTDGKISWENDLRKKKVLDTSVAKELQELMNAAVKNGTARALSRGVQRKIRNKITIGGKTGTITGGLPFGKRDWLTIYASPSNGAQGKGISIAVMNVNVKKWYVKSTFLAKKIINYYYQEIFPNLENDLSVNSLKPVKKTDKGV